MTTQTIENTTVGKLHYLDAFGRNQVMSVTPIQKAVVTDAITTITNRRDYCQTVAAKTKSGMEVEPWSDEAGKWSAAGALQKSWRGLIDTQMLEPTAFDDFQFAVMDVAGWSANAESMLDYEATSSHKSVIEGLQSVEAAIESALEDAETEYDEIDELELD